MCATWEREKRLNDLEWRDKRNAKTCTRMRDRRQNAQARATEQSARRCCDPVRLAELRAKSAAWEREKRLNDLEWRDKRNAKTCTRMRAKRMRIQYARMRVAMFETGITV